MSIRKQSREVTRVVEGDFYVCDQCDNVGPGADGGHPYPPNGWVFVRVGDGQDFGLGTLTTFCSWVCARDFAGTMAA